MVKYCTECGEKFTAPTGREYWRLCADCWRAGRHRRRKRWRMRRPAMDWIGDVLRLIFED